MRTRALAHLIGAELRSVLRDTAGLVIPIGLPMLIMVSNALAMGGEVLSQYLLPMIIVIVVATVGVVNIPSFLAAYRKSGVLRRLAVTPLHPATVLAAQGVVGMMQIAFGVALAVLVAVLAFGAPWAAAPWLTLATLLLATIALFAVGLVVAALAPTVNSALAIGLIAFFGMSSIGGMFGPVDHLPAGVSAIGEALPFGAAVHAMVDTWNGNGVPTANLISLGVCTLVSGLVAVRCFRWT